MVGLQIDVLRPELEQRLDPRASEHRQRDDIGELEFFCLCGSVEGRDLCICPARVFRAFAARLFLVTRP